MADPVSLALLATTAVSAGSAAYSASQIGGSTATPPAPTAAPPPAPPIQQPSGTPGGSAASAVGPGTSSPSFVGSSSLPQQQGYGSKTLLGQ
jgi:hypothetical protein